MAVSVAASGCSSKNAPGAKENDTIRKFQGYDTVTTEFKVVLYEGLEKVTRISPEGSVT